MILSYIAPAAMVPKIVKNGLVNLEEIIDHLHEIHFSSGLKLNQLQSLSDSYRSNNGNDCMANINVFMQLSNRH